MLKRGVLSDWIETFLGCDLLHLTDESHVQEVRSRSLSVLIVEDDEEDFFLISQALRGAGFDAHCERVDSEAAYVAKLDGKPDIILADYSLPGFSAPRALELLGKVP